MNDDMISQEEIDALLKGSTNISSDNDRIDEVQPSTKQSKVSVQPIQFQAFEQVSSKGVPENISTIQDVPLSVTVELGRTVKKISEVLEFGPGTIIEVEKLVGEHVDILVNGQYVAKGEVVVIDENYGTRITEIAKVGNRLSKI
ncbi:flagellar motor switch protein FliN [Alkaliphilus metalliredigens QYMF]|uniref:Flagellar motor switch protein FliN n=1 Tax=Alkaliphilus metalliredigens (strain QYMF) TaxID=293826 RepID=A6TKX1_ALKMQ|nr:flagellar motor switch protein FliN [Alkaliphilus metalliredigens]ABR46839.1 flagellar motor switch protein FliN [Alkaliphilus metalliredigens QYMF]